jgi:hypothetical protein
MPLAQKNALFRAVAAEGCTPFTSSRRIHMRRERLKDLRSQGVIGTPRMQGRRLRLWLPDAVQREALVPHDRGDVQLHGDGGTRWTL